MSKFKLGDVASEKRATWNQEAAGVPVVGLEHLVPGDVLLKNWTSDVPDSTFTKSFKKGQVLLGRRRVYLRKAVLAPFDGICSGDITVIEADANKLAPELLPFIIQNDKFFNFAMQGSAGSLSPRVKWAHLADYEFNLPAIDKQRRLADLLWAANDLKEAYKRAIAASDEMLKAKFREMTSNCESKIRLCKVASYINGGAFKPSDWGEQGLPIIRIQNLTDSSAAYNYYSGSYPEKIEINDGDILISWSATLGIFVWTRGKAILNQHIFRVDFKHKKPINQEYFIYAVSNVIEKMKEKTHGSTMKHIVKREFDATEIPYPSIEEQESIATFLRTVRNAQSAIQSSLSSLVTVIKGITNQVLEA